MRCPKCHYLSFDPEPRCKNCGYDLEVADPEPKLRPAARSAAAPLPDLKLRETPSATALAERYPAARRAKERYTMIEEPDDVVQDEPEIQLRESIIDESEGDDHDLVGRDDVTFEVVEAEPEPEEAAPLAVAPPLVAMPPAVSAPAAPAKPPAMPLFVQPLAGRETEPESLPDEDVIIRQFPLPSHARPPLSVRRPAPEAPRAARTATERRPGPLDRDLLEDLRRVEREEAEQLRADAHAIHSNLSALAAADRVDPMQRLAAAAVDAAVLGGIAAFVFWATLRVVQVSLFDLPLAALSPLLVFLVMMDVGYLLMFTAAGGQTIGKMLMGIRVVADDGGPAFVSIRQAAWRATLTVLSLGLAWLPALTGRGIALHDRLAHTRVVRA